ncbi:hypothetical protein R3P38DRAFT_3172944 [Favolaschia claudopus]|uniref:Uncharacterized protein n=1 Tax=Favolaschia claudopus TaxID=2862362 RepID=A0AAW0DN58_9AGAR
MQFSDLGFDNQPDEVSSAMLRVLERDGMDGTPKKKLFLGESADLDDEDDGDDEDSTEDSDNDEEGEEEKERSKSHRPKKKPRPSGADDANACAAAKT